MTEDAASHGLPTAMGFAAKNAIDVLRRRNVAIAPVLRAAGMSERALAESDPLHHRISAAGQVGSSIAPPKRSRTPLSVCTWPSGPIHAMRGSSYVASAAENLGEALALLARYSRIANEAARVKLTATPDGLVVEIGFVGLPRPLGRQGAEFLMAA